MTLRLILKPSLQVLFLSVILFLLAHSQQQQQAKPAFLLQVKVAINEKTYNPKNISISTNTSDIVQYPFNLSSHNFNKNVSLHIKLFAWYNNDWIARQSQTLKITDRRAAYPLQQHLLLRLLKYHSRQYQKILTDDKPMSILRGANLLVSFDPESSLMVSRLEDPEFFVDPQQYVLASSYNKDILHHEVNITFAAIERTDLFIDMKNHITQLGDIANKLRVQKPLFVSKHFPQDLTEPLHIWKLILQNAKSLSVQSKKTNQRLDIIQKRGYKGLISSDNMLPLKFDSELKPVADLAKSVNQTLVDNFLPAYDFVFSQTDILDKIVYLQSAVRRYMKLIAFDWVKLAEQWTNYAQMIACYAGILWILLDIFSYSRQNSLGLSISFGYFLNTWIFVQLITWSFRIGSMVEPWWIGGIVFIVGLLFHMLFSGLVERRFNKHQHRLTNIDKTITGYFFNLLMLAVIANVILHIWVFKDLRNFELVAWSFSEFVDLLNEYYIVLAVLPQILLNFRQRNTAPLTWLRLILLTAVSFKNVTFLLIDGECHLSLAILSLKQVIVLIILLIQSLIFIKGTPIVEIPQEIPQVEQKQEVKQSLSESSADSHESSTEKESSSNITTADS